MRQIIAMGGGGFSMEPDNPLLDRYILKQAKTGKPKVCFLPTASGDAEGYIKRFYEAFRLFDCVPSHLALSRPPASDLEDFVLGQDIVYVGGGNTRNMLAAWKARSLDAILTKAWDNGIVLAGISAGSICWFEEGVTDSIPGELTRLACLGLLAGSCCPHYDGEPERRPAYHRLLLSGRIKGGRAADDGTALHYIDRELFRAVSSRPPAMAYDVSAVGGGITENKIVPVYLGSE